MSLNGFWSRFWRKPRVSAPAEPIAPKTEAHLVNDRDPFELREEIPGTEGLTDASDGIHRQNPAQYRSMLWKLAWTDGRLEHPHKERLEAIEYQAYLEIEEIIRGLREKIAGDEANATAQRQKCEDLRKNLNERNTEYVDLIEERMSAPLEFSRVFGSFLMIVVILLTLSDIPLSLSLVASAFGLPREVELVNKGGRWQRASDSDEGGGGGFAVTAGIMPETLHLKVADVGEHTWLVLKYLWEPWFLAIGISCCGFFVKMFLDQVHRLAAMRRKEREVGAKPPQWRAWLLPGVSLVLLCVVGWTYWRLAQVRSNEQEIQALGTRLEQLGLDQASERDAVEKQLHAAMNQRGGVSEAAFFWLTLTVPFVAGAFLSAATRCFANQRQLKLLEGYVKERQKELAKMEEATTQMEMSVSARKLFVEQSVNTPEYRQMFLEARRAIYKHGYQRGVLVPETAYPESGVYAWCERKLRRQLGTRLRRTGSRSEEVTRS